MPNNKLSISFFTNSLLSNDNNLLKQNGFVPLQWKIVTIFRELSACLPSKKDLFESLIYSFNEVCVNLEESDDLIYKQLDKIIPVLLTSIERIEQKNLPGDVTSAYEWLEKLILIMEEEKKLYPPDGHSQRCVKF